MSTFKASSKTSKFHFFGGKGGVGKTTCASAFALSASAAARLRRDRRRVLLVSTDPAHSVRDALGARVPSNLRIVELDAPKAFKRWIAQHYSAAADVLEHGTWLDRHDIESLLNLPLPGIDELVGLIEIDRISQSFDTVVVDTAPTGHTLRLLAAPETVHVVADLLDALQEDHRVIRQQFGRAGKPEAADRLIDEIAHQAVDIARRLRSRATTEFHWVTLPEVMSVAESKDALAALAKARIPVTEIIVNRVLTDEGPCPLCDRRRAGERVMIAEIKQKLARGRRLTLVPALLREPRGVTALVSLAHFMADGSRLMADGHGRQKSISHQRSAMSHGVAPDLVNGAALVFVGGKGGVGKTTVAAALALSVAHQGRRVLLLSTDPAHSLEDVLGGDAPRGVDVLELNAAEAFAARAKEFQDAFQDMAGDAGAHGAANLLQLAPPGIDELFGMLTVFKARDEYDTIVVDTAPTGHALRLLQMPDVAREWVQVLMRLLLKYREVVHAQHLAAELVDVSKGVRELTAMLRDATATRFIVVTRAAQLPRAETERLIGQLRRLKLHVPTVVVNAMTLMPGECRRCRQTAADERVQLTALRRRLGRRVIIRTPLVAPSPRGAAALDAWQHAWLIADRR